MTWNKKGKKYKKKRRKIKTKKPQVSKAEAILIVIAGMYLGTMFTFIHPYVNSFVEKEEAICITTEFVSYEENYEYSGRPKEFRVKCRGCEILDIDRLCIDEEMITKLKMLSAGDEITLIIHPKSQNILDMRTENMILLEFDDAQDIITKDARGFILLGLFMYAMGIYGIVNLFRM